jgi:25S rRNA (cytosine2278-C5)-methyltransferase
MKGKGQITALERDKKRFQTLKMMLERAGATNVTPKNLDFLSTDPFDPVYADVSHMYVLLPFGTAPEST